MKKKDNKDFITNLVIALVAFFLIGSFVLMIVKEIDKNRHNHIKEVSYSEYANEIGKDKYTIVLLARPNCSHCVNYKPQMNEALEKYNLEALYLDVNELSKDDFIKLHDSISAISTEFNGSNPVISTPTTIIFKNGEELESVSANIGYNGFVNMLIRNGVIENEK